MPLKPLPSGGLFALLFLATLPGCSGGAKDTGVAAQEQSTDAAEAEKSSQFMEEQMRKGGS